MSDTVMEFVPDISTFKRERSLPVVFGFECWTRNSNHRKKSGFDGNWDTDMQEEAGKILRTSTGNNRVGEVGEFVVNCIHF